MFRAVASSVDDPSQTKMPDLGCLPTTVEDTVTKVDQLE
jgi:hypothetical protein